MSKESKYLISKIFISLLAIYLSGYLNVSLNEKCLKNLSVKIRHYCKGIIIPHSLPNNGCVFHKRDGLPIKVSVESFLDIIIQCSHNVNHIFRIPIESIIEWKILNGIRDGAFKHGNGLRAKYSDTDNENCVIYYPGIRGSKDDYKDKEIPISISIISNSIRGSIENFSSRSYCCGNDNTLLPEYKANQLLTLSLKQRQGFLDKMYYEGFVTVKQANEKELEFSEKQVVTHIQGDENSNCMYSFDKKSETFSIENKTLSKCSQCDLKITFKVPTIYSATNQTKISTDTNRFLSSEYIKISNSLSEYVYSANRLDVDFDISNNNERIDKFRICNCPVIKIKETFWTVTAGPFPCGERSNSIIYYSLNEKELSKSPITLRLYERNLFEVNDNEFPHFIDEKKFWIVRKAIMGG